MGFFQTRIQEIANYSKKTKANFLKLVESCLDNTNILNIKRMRLCSKKARQYMKLYVAVKAIEEETNDDSNSEFFLNKHSILEESLKMYRYLQKKKNTHRSVLVSDLRELENEIDNIDKTSVKNEDAKDHLIRSLVRKMITL